MFRRTLLAALSGAVLSVSFSPPASATVGTASLDWSQLVLEVLPIPGQPAPDWSFAQRAGTASTTALTPDDASDSHSHTSFNWDHPAAVHSSTSHAEGTAVASGSMLSATAASTASPFTASDPFQQNTASAVASRSANLLLQAPAAVVVTVPYLLEVSGEMFDFDDYSTAHIGGSAQFQPSSGSGFSSATRAFDLDSRFSATSSQSGTLIFGLVVDGAGTVNLSLDANAFSSSHDAIPVPEPSSALQLMAGLAALGAIALRRGRRWQRGPKAIQAAARAGGLGPK
jgi:hypothetical protein